MPRTAATKTDKTAQKRLLTEALEAFEETTATGATVLRTDLGHRPGEPDAEIRLGTGKALLVEVKRTLTPANLGQVVAQLKRFARPGVLVTDYVAPPMAERLKALDVPFLDAAGNVYLRQPGMLVYVTGRKPRTRQRAERPVRALRPRGLKVIFALLCLPDLVAAPYRDIAKNTGVALGTVVGVVKDLERLGYLRPAKGKTRRFENRLGLVDAWVAAYPRELRPRLTPRRFRVPDAEWWKRQDLTAFDMWLGGEPAAGLLTRYLRPEIVTVYGDTRFAALARKIHPLKDDHGNLELLQRFWEFELPQYDKRYPLVPPLLIYADLVATADARNLETAEMIRERFLAHA